MKISGSFFAFHYRVPLICASVHLKIEIVIKKGGGTGPCETLATLDFEKVLHSTHCPEIIQGFEGRITQRIHSNRISTLFLMHLYPFSEGNYNMEKIEDILQKRILVLDGAMGTMLQRYKFQEADFRGERFKDWPHPLQGNNDLLSLTQPQAIEEVHRKYFEAGADIVETNTFSGTSIAMADYGMEELVYELNLESAKIAKKVAQEFTAKEPQKPRFVAGSIGPTNKTASLSPDVNDPGFRAVSFNELRLAYKEQVEALLDGGVDILLVETIFDTLNAKAALFAIEEVKDERNIKVPVMVSGTITDASGRTLSGQTAEAFLISVSHIPIVSVGFNCALGAKQLTPHLEVISAKSDFAISAHPNAGLPNAFGEYDETPEQMAEQIKEYLEKGLVNIVGGCCGTTPEHIKAIAELAKEYKPRPLAVNRFSEI